MVFFFEKIKKVRTMTMFEFFIKMFNNSDVKRKFTKIYSKNLFKGDDSISGGGSNLYQTRVIRNAIPILLKEMGVKTMIDAPCGDLFWMKEVDLPVEKYIGIDIVDEIIEENKKKYAASDREFVSRNIIDEKLPRADLIFCRDCLVHLSFEQGIKAIKNFKESGAKYLLTTTFVDREKNIDLGKHIWRTLNLERAPFNFPKPIKVINEGCTEGNGSYSGKSLGLWLLEDISF